MLLVLLLITSPVTVLIHEVGHGIVGMLITRGSVTIQLWPPARPPRCCRA
jgi:hypothetical protein